MRGMLRRRHTRAVVGKPPHRITPPSADVTLPSGANTTRLDNPTYSRWACGQASRYGARVVPRRHPARPTRHFGDRVMPETVHDLVKRRLHIPRSSTRSSSVLPDAKGANISGTLSGTLSKGQRRKLNALRKSVGGQIGEQAFASWLSAQSAAAGTEAEQNSALIVDTLWTLVHAARRQSPARRC